MAEEIKEYSNGEITVVWQQQKCTHSKNCWTQLRNVFDPFKRPWIEPKGATSQQIMEQVDKCPSGALSYHKNK